MIAVKNRFLSAMLLAAILTAGCRGDPTRSHASGVDDPAAPAAKSDPNRVDQSPPPPVMAADPIAGKSAQDNSTTASDEETDSPAACVRRVNDLRQSGRLEELLELVVEDQRSATYELIKAVDQLILENRVLQMKIKAAGGTATADLFDRSGVANLGGVFAQDVRVVRQELSGKTSVVTIQVADQLPLSTVTVAKQQGQWLIQPDPPIPGVLDELHNLSKAMHRVGQAVEREPMTVKQIKKEMEMWLTPVMRRLRACIEASHSTAQ